MNNQISRNRQIVTLVVMAFVSAIFATLLTSPVISVAAVHDNGSQKSKDKPKDPKCNNVKILVKVSKIPKGSNIVIAQATLGGKTVCKTQYVQGDNKVAVPLLFKKLSPCPVIGDGFSGELNDTSFVGTLVSLKKPNKVNVALS